MNFDVEGLRAFIKVAEFGSFHRAADRLFVSHSALSRRVSKLEDHLGVRLLERTTRRVVLTAVGRNFLPQALDLVNDLERSFNNLRKVASRGSGQVVVAALPTVSAGALPSVMAQYVHAFPENRIRVLDLSAREVLDAVLRNEAEFGLTLADIADGQANAELFVQDRFVIACHREHPLARKQTVDWSDLRSYRVIAPGLTEGNRPMLDLSLGAKTLKENWHIEVQRFSTGAAMAELGVGVLVVPGITFSSNNYPLLVRRPLAKPEVVRDIVIVRRGASSLSPAAAEFLAMLRKFGESWRTEDKT